MCNFDVKNQTMILLKTLKQDPLKTSKYLIKIENV